MLYERLMFTLVILLIPVISIAKEVQDDAWFDDDFEARIAKVNDGDLVFLTKPPAQAGPSITIAELLWTQTVWITAGSL